MTLPMTVTPGSFTYIAPARLIVSSGVIVIDRVIDRKQAPVGCTCAMITNTGVGYKLDPV